MLAQVCQENINRLLLGERNAVSFGLSDHLILDGYLLRKGVAIVVEICSRTCSS